MELFVVSDLPCTTLDAPYNTLLDIAANSSGDTAEHNNFLRLLQHAVSLETRILSLSWDAALESVGPPGATGSVNQGLLNYQVTLAFKRFKVEVTDPRLTQQDFRSLQYDAMINELTVLSNRAIRQHSNIAVFVGLCFEMSPGADAVWPVLAFTKSTHGDLGILLTQGDQQEPDFLLGVCTEIAQGIEILHKCGVVHGDLKPGNILVSQDPEQSATSVTLTDFGCSRFATPEKDLVRLQRSEPWEAPEWRNHQSFTVSDAKKLDMYSFGLLCIWIFFKDETLPLKGFETIKVNTAFMDKSSQAFNELQFNKHSTDDLILMLAESLVNANKEIGFELQTSLRRLFQLTLTKEPKFRAACMGDIIEILSDGNRELATEGSPVEELPQLEPIVLPQWHGTLQMDRLLFQLEACDYRIHRFIVQYLKEMAISDACVICAKNAAFQLALCHGTGFGTEMNENVAKEWLSRSGKTDADIADAIQKMRKSKEGAGTMQMLAKLGYRNDTAFRFNRDGLLTDAIAYYHETILAHRTVLGPAATPTLRLQGIYLDLLRWNDQGREALDYALEMLEASDDLDPSDQVEVKNKLSTLYADLGDYEAAGRITMELRDIFSHGPESEHSERLENQQDYVEHLLRQNRIDEAIPLAEKALRDCEQELGPLHSSTRGAMRCLAASYHADGQLERAAEVDEKLVKSQEGFVMDMKVNPKLVEDLSRMGVRYYELGKRDLALNCYRKVEVLMEKDREMAQHAAIGVNNYAANLIRHGKLDLATEILNALLPRALEHLGDGHRESALIMGNLAYVCSRRGELERAESLERQVVAIRKRVLGRSHDHTITAMGNLKSTLMALGRYKDAAVVGWEAYLAIDDRRQASLTEKIDVVRTVARNFESAEAFAEALPFLEKELDLIGKLSDPDSGGRLSVMALLALCYCKTDRQHDARTLTVGILNEVGNGALVDNENFLPRMVRLGEELLARGFRLEVEQILALAFMGSQNSEPTSHLLDVRRKLANLLSKYLERYELREADIRFDPSVLDSGGSRLDTNASLTASDVADVDN